MQRERVSEDVYVFTSDLYAQVTAGAVVTPSGSILIDTLPYPQETREIKSFLEDRLETTVRYVINTHYHADHTYGTCFFPDAVVASHARCRELLDTIGRSGLVDAQAQVQELVDVHIVLPDVIFEQGCLNIHLDDKTVTLLPSPGHSPDSVIVLIPEERVLFASDTLMPVPTLVDGSLEDLIRSLEAIPDMPVDNVVQGHGEVILRGEIQAVVDDDIRYLRTIHERVTRVIKNGGGPDQLQRHDIESCGKSRIPLNGLVSDLHMANLYRLYQQIRGSF